MLHVLPSRSVLSHTIEPRLRLPRLHVLRLLVWMCCWADLLHMRLGLAHWSRGLGYSRRLRAVKMLYTRSVGSWESLVRYMRGRGWVVRARGHAALGLRLRVLDGLSLSLHLLLLDQNLPLLLLLLSQSLGLLRRHWNGIVHHLLGRWPSRSRHGGIGMRIRSGDLHGVQLPGLEAGLTLHMGVGELMGGIVLSQSWGMSTCVLVERGM